MEAKEEIKQRLTVSELLKDYVQLVPQSNGSFKCLCPFHDDHNPSMIVDDKKDLAWCFVCNSGGDIFALTEKLENCSFVEALRFLGQKLGIEVGMKTISSAGRGVPTHS